MKRLLISVIGFLFVPAILFLWITTTESGLIWTYQQFKSQLPSNLTIGSLNGKLIGPFTLTNLKVKHDEIIINSNLVIVDWHPIALLTTKISISDLQIQDLDIEIKKTKKPDKPVTLPDIYFPWLAELKQSTINNVRIRNNSRIFNIKQIKLNVSTLLNQFNIKELKIDTDTVSLNIDGKFKPVGDYRHDFKIHWLTKLTSNEILKGRGKLFGDVKTTLLNQQLTGPLNLTLNAQLSDLLKQFNWQAKINVNQFDTLAMGINWLNLKGNVTLDATGNLNTALINGKLKGKNKDFGVLDADFNVQRLDDTLQIDRLHLHSSNNDTDIFAKGIWTPDKNGGDINLSLNWKNLRWPMQDAAWFNSSKGHGTINGRIDKYQFELTSDRPWPQAPPSEWYARASGNIEGLHFQTLRVTALNGEAITNGRLNWLPHFSWQAQLSAKDINPENLLPQWPGQLSAKLQSNGQYKNSQWTTDVDITQLAGTLRGYPVTLKTRAGWQSNYLNVNHFAFKSGDSKINLKGQYGKNLNFEWNLSSSNLAELYPQATGQLQSSGMLSGTLVRPVIKTSLEGKDLFLPNYEIGSVSGAMNLDLQNFKQLDMQLSAQSLNIYNNHLESLSIKSDVHHLVAQGIFDNAIVDIKLLGELNDNGWQGRIAKASLQSKLFNHWQLNSPASLSINKSNLMLEPLCWHNSENASLCSSIEYKEAAWLINLKTVKLPLMVLNPWLPNDLELDGTIDAKADLQFQSTEQLLGHISFTMPEGVINYPLLEGEYQQWKYHNVTGEIALKHDGLKASAELNTSKGDKFKGTLALPGAKIFDLKSHLQPLETSVHLSIHNLGLIEAIVPDIQELKGELELNLTMNGSLKQPTLDGNAHLLHGSLKIPRLGLLIDQLNLSAESEKSEKIKFRLNAHSGEGNLAVRGHTQINRQEKWPTEISIKGNQFEISRIPEARVTVTPDLQVKIQNTSVDIKGKLHIPYAKLQPKDITTAVRVSDDSIIIGGEQPVEQKWLITSRTRLILGDQFNFFGFGFEGKFGGSLLIEDEPGQLTKATGEITIPEGRYRAYGQRLDVEHGRLLYTGSPVTNPGLDLRAVRQIDKVTAGIKVRGSLKQPQLELFSIPAMGQTDILSYLIIGSPIENATGDDGAIMAKAALALGITGGDHIARILGDQFGLDEMRVESSDTGDQASLVVGRYLSPKLYVSYGVGLIEAFNTFTIRYKISDKWQLKAESGEYQGADILYTIER